MNRDSTFISYRRGDFASVVAGRLNDSLISVYGKHRVFIDVDKIAPGDDFEAAILFALSRCRLFVAIIDPAWLEQEGEMGRHRSDKDYVQFEIERALESDVVVIPVLIGGAAMPTASQLPSSIRALATRNAVTLASENWRTDLQRIIDVIGLEEQDQQEVASTKLASMQFVVEKDRGGTIWIFVRDQKVASFRSSGKHVYKLRPGVGDLRVNVRRKRSDLTFQLDAGERAVVHVTYDRRGLAVTLEDIR